MQQEHSFIVLKGFYMLVNVIIDLVSIYLKTFWLLCSWYVSVAVVRFCLVPFSHENVPGVI